MTKHVKPLHVDHDDEHHDADSRVVFGFWVYLMSDCLLFGSLFAVYAVLHNNTNGGPPGRELFSLPFVLTQTLVLLASSFTCGMASLAAYRDKKNMVFTWISLTFLLGLAFLAMMTIDFTQLVQQGNSWQRNGFLSAYFNLIGTHGMHIAAGLLWMLVLLGLIAYRGLISSTLRRITCLRLFWHFLNIVWIFIFTIVYLMEAN